MVQRSIDLVLTTLLVSEETQNNVHAENFSQDVELILAICHLVNIGFFDHLVVETFCKFSILKARLLQSDSDLLEVVLQVSLVLCAEHKPE